MTFNINDCKKVLFWRIDLFKRSFSILNSCEIDVLSNEDFRFFKDKSYREKILLKEDKIKIEQLIKRIENRSPVNSVFRVHNNNSVKWFKLSGCPVPDHQYYQGIVEDITEQIPSLQIMLASSYEDTFDFNTATFPIAFFSRENRTFKKANTPFLKYLKTSAEDLAATSLDDLIKNDKMKNIHLESIKTNHRNYFELSLTSPNNSSEINAWCLLEYIHDGGKTFLRLAIPEPALSINAPEKTAAITNRQKVLDDLCNDLSECQSVEAMLNRIYADRSLFPGTDTIFFSDIYAKKNKVIVYSVGKLKEPIPSGTQFPYAGTIAENIERENLEYLIVDDTHSSIKAIDWMVFVPQGLSSYIAKALHFRGTMRTVLILSSCQKNIYNKNQAEDLTLISSAFHRQLNTLRRKNIVPL